MESTLVHNNTIWSTKGSAVAYGISGKHTGGLPEIRFHNNILVSRGPQILGRPGTREKIGVYRGNLYWAMGERGFRVEGFKSLAEWAAATGQERVDGRLVGLFADPALPRSGPALLTDPADLHRLVEYQLREGSPARGAGLDLRKMFGIDPGPADFYGNPLPSEGAPSMGAHEPRARP
jgi:hypothetical protein